MVFTGEYFARGAMIMFVVAAAIYLLRRVPAPATYAVSAGNRWSARPLVGWLLARRGILLAQLAIVLCFVAGVVIGAPTTEIWRLFGVQHEGLAYPDLAVITHALECVSRGVDPYVTPDCDPWDRPYNYTRVLLLLSDLSIRPWHTTTLGTALAVAFSLTMAVILPARTVAGHVVAALAMLSYPVLWSIERGNTDLAIFIGYVLVAFLIARPTVSVWRGVLAALLTVGLFIIKLYPVAACIVFWRDRRTMLQSLSIAAAAVATYVASDPEMFKLIRETTPFWTVRAFGMGALVGDLYLMNVAQYCPKFSFVPPHIQTLAYACVGVALFVAAGIALRYHRPITHAIRPSRGWRFQLALLGLSTYCLAYCLGTSFNYRLVFLVLAIPCLLRGWEEGRSRLHLAVAIAILAFLLANWQTHEDPFYRPEVWPIVVGVFGMLLFMLFAVALASYNLSLLREPRDVRRASSSPSAHAGSDAESASRSNANRPGEVRP